MINKKIKAVKKTKGLAIVMLILILAFSITGCQENTEKTTESTTITESSKTTEATTAIETETDTASEMEMTTEAATESVTNISTIDFQDNQWYAVAYLGYEKIDDLTPYLNKYLNGENPDSFIVSEGDIYLIIPRYSNMQMKIIKDDIEGKAPATIYETDNCKPFIVHCNISDIFADAIIEFTYQGETVEYSPYISLEDGSVIAGERGLLISENASQSTESSEIADDGISE